MKSRLIKIIIKTTLTSSILTFILVAVFQMINSDRHFRNFYIPFFTEILSFFFVWLLSFSLLPIFLNLYEGVRSRFLLCFISFYSLLIMLTILVVCDKTIGFNENPIYVMLILLPFYTVLTYNFINWRKFIKH